ncbi:MAG: asparaginase [Clostridia bacterium]|nr:asparaginase [Clostridia bacterium]
MPEKLVEILRSGVLESVHRGDIVVVDREGKILNEIGDGDRICFWRSASKPLQTIAALETGIIEKFGLDLKEIALMSASHSGEAEHIKVLEGIIEKVGIRLEMLACGPHEPINKEAVKELVHSGKEPSKLHCNCSGKHIGLIAASKALGLPVEGYHREEHGIQKRIDEIISEFSGVETKNFIKGVDGCGIPVHAIPLKSMAAAYANICNPLFMGGKYSITQNYITSSMTMYPEMVAGQGRLDTKLMKTVGDRVVGKIGAEGVYCAGLLGKGIGIALKVTDGNARAVGPAIIEVLYQLKVIVKEELDKLKEFWNPDILNHIGEKVGEIKAVFKMKGV